MEGPDVLKVQQALAAKGFDPGPLDGIYGPLTARAVTDFQLSVGLPGTGVVCGELYGRLGVTGCSSIEPCPPPEACRVLLTTNPLMSGADVAAVQRALAAQGFDPGRVDGVFGPETCKAVRTFQSARGLVPHGTVAGPEYQELGISCVGYPGYPPKRPYPPVPREPVSLIIPRVTGRHVAAVQMALVLRGFDVGTVDGVYGPETATTVESFRRAAGLAVTKQVDAELYLVLHVNCL